MAAKKAGRKAGKAAVQQPDIPVVAESVKLTLRVSGGTAQRLAIESAMTGESQSGIADRVLGAYLKRWRLPSVIGGSDQGGGESAAPAD